MPRRPDPVDPNTSPGHLFGASLRFWRDELCRMSQREAAARALCDDGDLSRWERGLTRPQPDTTARLDALYGAGGLLVALHAVVTELERLRRGRLDGDPSAHDGDDEMRRRAAMQLMAGLSAGSAVPGNIDAMLTSVERALGIGDQSNLDDWEQLVQEYADLGMSRPPGALVHDLIGELIQVSTQIDRDPSSPARIGMLRVSANLSGLLALDLADGVGQWPKARRAFATARRVADTLGERDLRVWIRAQEARYGFYAGSARSRVLNLTEEAIGIADGVPSAGLALAYSGRAEALAELGDGKQAHAALDRLSDVCERRPGVEGSSAWQWRWCGQHVAPAYVGALLGDGRASDAIDQGLSALPRDALAPVTTLRMVHALSLVRERHIGDGLDLALDSVMGMPLNARRRMVAGQVLSALPEKARDLPAARELRTLVA